MRPVKLPPREALKSRKTTDAGKSRGRQNPDVRRQSEGLGRHGGPAAGPDGEKKKATRLKSERERWREDEDRSGEELTEVARVDDGSERERRGEGD
jgi:hypothetical protein